MARCRTVRSSDAWIARVAENIATVPQLLQWERRRIEARVRELLEPLGCTASKTIVDDYLREVRPLFAPPPRVFQRTVYRPGEICQFDLWEPSHPVPVGHGHPVVKSLGRALGHGALAQHDVTQAARQR